MQIIRPECFLAHMKFSEGTLQPSLRRCMNVTEMWMDWKRFSPRDVADCWIFHESFETDLRTCLLAYEKVLPSNKGLVNWTRFDDLAAHPLRYQDGKKSLSTQSQRHAPCESFFSRDGLSDDLIKTSDPYLFQKLGYSSCCSPSSKRIW